MGENEIESRRFVSKVSSINLLSFFSYFKLDTNFQTLSVSCFLNAFADL